MRWLDDITDTMGMSLSNGDRQGSLAVQQSVGSKIVDTTERLT